MRAPPTDIVLLTSLTPPGRTPLSTFRPPPRFASTRFSHYHPQHPSQREALERVSGFVASLAEPTGFRWPWQGPPEGRGLYLDGGFGTGKTHLLAACYHATESSAASTATGADAKAYLSFQELVYAIGVLGMAEAKRAFSPYRLVLLDEFELDDPGNTLIVKTFLADLFARGGSLVTTSNTTPEAQGRGRFNAEQFRREIQSIAERFEVITLGGPDYRHRDRLGTLLDDAAMTAHRNGVLEGVNLDRHGPLVEGEWSDLIALLREVHPIRYRGLLDQIGTLYLRGVETIAGQNDALRFVHFIDKLYDQRVGLRMAGEIALEDLFHPSYRTGAYQKKHDRCLSRLTELFAEP